MNLTISHVQFFTNKTKKKKYIEKAAAKVCTTIECVRASADILDFVDLKLDPCDDFYAFSCGTYLNDTFLTGDKVSMDMFGNVREKTHEQLASLVEEDIKANETRTFRLVKQFYRACMNETRIEEQGLQPMLDIMKSLGGWPCVEPIDRWNPTNTWNWMDANKALTYLGFSAFSLFSVTVDTDMKNSSARILTVIVLATDRRPSIHIDRNEFSIFSWTKHRWD